MEDSKLFIDADIILDLLDSTRISHKSSKELIETCLTKEIAMAISDDIVTTVYYLSQKLVEREKLLNFIGFLNKNFTILTFDAKIIDVSIKICLKNSSYDFEDTLQAVCAKTNNYNTIITNDKKFPNIDGIVLKRT